MRVHATTPLTRLLVTHLLEDAADGVRADWTLQGLGMLRLYLSPTVRLHVWDSAEAYPGASKLHDHPWDFTSHIILGRLVNVRYERRPLRGGRPTHHMQTIVCGEGGCSLGDVTDVEMREESRFVYEAGQSYSQISTIVHESIPEDGTVTIIERVMHEDTEHARVFSDYGTEWVSAEPRPATPDEVKRMTRKALARWT